MNSPRKILIDAHHHLWQFKPEEFPWIGDGMDVLRRDYLPADLEEVAHEAGITGTVVVQARQSIEETEWLSSLAEKSDLIRAVVGWAPLAQPDVEKDLEKIAVLRKVKGLRHILHDEPDPYYMCRDDFNRGVALLERYGLRYDLLIFEKHLPQTIEFVDRHPNQIFILDHLAKPRIREGAISPWRENLRELARRQNVYCKLSGMVTEANWSSWDEQQLRPYIDVVLDSFGPQRTMFGSDWPVMRLATSYTRWFEVLERAIAQCSESERGMIMGGTATEAYGL